MLRLNRTSYHPLPFLTLERMPRPRTLFPLSPLKLPKIFGVSTLDAMSLLLSVPLWTSLLRMLLSLMSALPIVAAAYAVPPSAKKERECGRYVGVAETSENLGDHGRSHPGSSDAPA
jgi:hypothetical protein